MRARTQCENVISASSQTCIKLKEEVVSGGDTCGVWRWQLWPDLRYDQNHHPQAQTRNIVSTLLHRWPSLLNQFYSTSNIFYITIGTSVVQAHFIAVRTSGIRYFEIIGWEEVTWGHIATLAGWVKQPFEEGTTGKSTIRGRNHW